MSDDMDRASNQERRYRLTPEEEKWLLQWRQTGAIPKEMALHSDRNVNKMYYRYRQLKRMYDTALEELEIAQGSLEVFDTLKDTQNDSYTIGKKKKKNGKSRSVAFALASDWHLEERVDPATVNNLNEFDLKIAKKRVEHFFDRIVYLTSIMRQETEIEHLVLALLGDLLSGTIHEDLMEVNQLSTVETIYELTNLIRAGIDYLVDEGGFESIHVPCCFGNHSRFTVKKRVATAHNNSFETLMYRFLAMLYSDSDVVTFQVPVGYHAFVKPFDKFEIRFHHGDAIRYGGGVGGISIPVNKAVAQWNRSRNVYLDCFGHFHQTRDGGHWISNGSLIGYSAYALSIKADYEAPQQTFFTIEENKGKTFTAPIILEEPAFV